jgi:hypothetical protein
MLANGDNQILRRCSCDLADADKPVKCQSAQAQVTQLATLLIHAIYLGIVSILIP